MPKKTQIAAPQIGLRCPTDQVAGDCAQHTYSTEQYSTVLCLCVSLPRLGAHPSCVDAPARFGLELDILWTGLGLRRVRNKQLTQSSEGSGLI